MKKFTLNRVALSLVFAVMVSLGLSGCTNSTDTTSSSVTTEVTKTITEKEVLDIQKQWGEGIVTIGEVYTAGGDYRAAATDHINKFYHYQAGSVLFKPTLASVTQFRTDFEGALSYFVGGNEKFAEDSGFAKSWNNVRWESTGVKSIGNMAVAMGNYYFTPTNGGDDVKVEYSFAYTKNANDELKIILHDSHFPFVPAATE